MDQENNPESIPFFAEAPESVPQIDNPLLPDPATTPPDVEVSADLLGDPTEYPIDNQAELAELADYVPQTTDVIDHNFQEQLQVATESLGELLDLHHTIKTSGVSSHDMAGLMAIQNRLTRNDITIPKVSIEEHLGLFLPTRSIFNQSLGLESIATVIVDTIKGWIRKLIELVMSGYRWVKNLKQKHVILDAQLVKARDVLIAVRKIFLSMKTLNGVMGSQAVDAINELTATSLVHSSLPRNRVTLYGFSNESAIRDTKAIYTNALDTSNAIGQRIKEMTELLDNREVPGDDGLTALNELSAVMVQVEDMLEFSDDDEYLLKELGTDFWEQVDQFRRVNVIDFDILVKHYGSAADALGRIRSIKLEDPIKAERVQHVVDGVTKAMNHLNKIVNFFNGAAQAQVGAAKIYRSYYQQAIEILLLDFKTKSPSPDSVKTMKGLIQQLSALK